MNKLPKISFVLCTFNGERTLNECLSSFFSQDYPKDRLELLIADGGSKDKTITIIKKYERKYPKVIRFMYNSKQYADGKGMGVDNTSRKATGEMIMFIDQDNILIQKNWLKKMVGILLNNKHIVAVQSRMAVPSKGTILDKYLCSIGIEDPFVIHYSLNAQIILNPQNFKNNPQGFYEYTVDKNNFFYAGGNGFLIRRKPFFDSGGWVQDVDNFYRMADKKYTIAIPKNILLYHKTSTKFMHFIKKRGFYARHYLLHNYIGRDFYWFNLKKNNIKQNLRFLGGVMYNLLLIPGLIAGIKMAIKKRTFIWLIHPIILSIITLIYLYSYVYAKVFKKENNANI